MLTVYHRAANDRDIKASTDHQGTLARNLTTVAFPIAAAVFGIVYVRWRSLITAGVVGGGLFVASLVSNLRFFRNVKQRMLSKADPNAVEVFDVSASSVLDLEPLGDNAPAFCFFVGDGKALLVVGQWLLKRDSFPAESFRLNRWADTKKPIRIEITGRPLDAEASTVRLRHTHKFGEIEVFDANRETLQEDVDRVLTRRGSAARGSD